MDFTNTFLLFWLWPFSFLEKLSVMKLVVYFVKTMPIFKFYCKDLQMTNFEIRTYIII